MRVYSALKALQIGIVLKPAPVFSQTLFERWRRLWVIYLRAVNMLCNSITHFFLFFQFKFLQFKINLVQSDAIAELESYGYPFCAWLRWCFNIPLKTEQQKQKLLELLKRLCMSCASLPRWKHFWSPVGGE